MKMTAAVAKTIALPGTGDQMPTVALGTWTVWESKEEICKCVKAAIDAGYRHIDCAWAYENEDEVGKAIAEKIADDTIKREDIFVTTKVWNNHHSRERVQLNVKKSLEKLQLSYADLVLVHWPTAFQDGDVCFPKGDDGKIIFAHHDLLDTWKGMEDCVRAGLVRNIGVSNFNSLQIQRVLDVATVKPCNLQVEINPTHTNEKLIQFAKSRNIQVSSYAPLGAPGRPWKDGGDPCAIKDPVVTGIASRKSKSPAQVILRWHLQQGLCICVKSLNVDRIRQNLDLFDVELSKEEMAKISGLNQNFRAYAERISTEHPEYPFHVEF